MQSGEVSRIQSKEYFVNGLKICPSVGEREIYFKMNGSKTLSGLSGLYVNDSFNASNSEFQKRTRTTLICVIQSHAHTAVLNALVLNPIPKKKAHYSYPKLLFQKLSFIAFSPTFSKIK